MSADSKLPTCREAAEARMERFERLLDACERLPERLVLNLTHWAEDWAQQLAHSREVK